MDRHQLLESLRDPEYRKAFGEDVGTGLAFQIRHLRDRRGWSQEELAHRTGPTTHQETIAQWEDPDYGRYTLKSLKQLAAAFDVALVVRFAPFNELIEWTANLSPEKLTPKSFGEEIAAVRIESAVTTYSGVIVVTPSNADAGSSLYAGYSTVASPVLSSAAGLMIRGSPTSRLPPGLNPALRQTSPERRLPLEAA